MNEEQNKMPKMDPAEMAQRENRSKIQRYVYLNQSAQKGQIVFTGSSLMEQFPLNELMMSMGIQKVAYNRGFGGYITTQLMEVLDECVLDLEPSTIFINIGTNDLDRSDDPIPTLISNYRQILQRIRTRLPECRIVMMAYYPVANMALPFAPPGRSPRTNAVIDKANEAAAELAKEMGCEFISVNHVLKDENGYLKDEFASDPIHMWPNAYAKILEELKPLL